MGCCALSVISSRARGDTKAPCHRVPCRIAGAWAGSGVFWRLLLAPVPAARRHGGPAHLGPRSAPGLAAPSLGALCCRPCLCRQPCWHTQSGRIAALTVLCHQNRIPATTPLASPLSGRHRHQHVPHQTGSQRWAQSAVRLLAEERPPPVKRPGSDVEHLSLSHSSRQSA